MEGLSKRQRLPEEAAHDRGYRLWLTRINGREIPLISHVVFF
jgi:hypothetical protein